MTEGERTRRAAAPGNGHDDAAAARTTLHREDGAAAIEALAHEHVDEGPQPHGRCRPLGTAPELAQHRSFFATFAAVGMLGFPGVAGVATCVLYLGSDTWSWTFNRSGGRALASGTLIGLVAWLVLALVLRRMSSARGAVPSAFAQLDEARIELRLRFDRVLAESHATPRPSLPEARAAILAAETRLAGADARADWILAIGYVSVWRHLHRADEAILEAAPKAELVAGAGRDLLRVTGSTMPQATTLALAIDAAANAVLPGALFPLAALTPAKAPAAPAADQPTLAEAEARALLRQTRRAINDFRDGSRTGLVRARNALVLTIGATGVLAFLLFALALLAGATRDEVAAGASFYVVAGLVGLFRQLQLASARDTVATEDFGLQAVRLIHTPLFSGIAGVAGVVLTKLVTDDTRSGLAQIFDMGQNRLGLVIAAVFGLAPGLLISQLHARAEGYKSDLKNTETGQGAGAKD